MANPSLLCRPGDILMYRTGANSPFVSKIIGIYEMFVESAPIYTQYSHIAAVETPDNKLEATWPRSRRAAIDWSDPRLELWRLKAMDPAQTSTILNACRSRLGEWYGLPDILFFGYLPVRHMDICTTFIKRNYAEGGVYFPSPRHKLPLPDDFPLSGMMVALWKAS